MDDRRVSLVGEGKNLAASTEATETEIVGWRIHLLRQQPERLPLLLSIAVFVCLVAWLLFHNILVICAGLFMLYSATSDYFLPATYRLTDHAAYSRSGINQFVLEWKAVRRVLLYKDGVRLSPLPTATRLDAFRGVYLRFASEDEPGNKEEILETIARLRPAPPAES